MPLPSTAPLYPSTSTTGKAQGRACICAATAVAGRPAVRLVVRQPDHTVAGPYNGRTIPWPNHAVVGPSGGRTVAWPDHTMAGQEKAGRGADPAVLLVVGEALDHKKIRISASKR